MSCAAHALDVPEAFCWAFAALGILVSFFYGICAVTIAFRPPEFRNPNQFIRSREVWTQCLKDVFRHPWYLDQAWFNFAGSVLGWSSLGCAIWRVRRPPYSFGLAEAGLFLVGAVGIVGHLPSTINRIVGAIGDLVQAVGEVVRKAGGVK
jgi:hypothetical protein